MTRGLLFKSLLAGAAGSAVDYSVMLALVEAAGVPVTVAVPLGVVSGGTANFFLNRRMVFGLRGRDGTLRHAVRYLGVMLLLVLLHAGAVGCAHHQLNLPILPSKMAMDFLIFGIGQPLLLRRLVFPVQSLKLAPR